MHGASRTQYDEATMSVFLLNVFLQMFNFLEGDVPACEIAADCCQLWRQRLLIIRRSV